MAKRNNNEEETRNPNPQPEGGNLPSSSGSMPAYLQAAARLSAARPLGANRLDLDVATITVADDSTSIGIESTVPGIAVLDYIPTFGISTNPNSALNRAAFMDFNTIREAISGNRPYEPVDHMIMRICVDSMRELYYYIRRAYTIISSYSAMNLYRPRHIMEAMGLDFDEWRRNAANVYQWLLLNANALAPFPTVPMGTISGRRAVFNSAIFVDGDAPTSQMYIFNQKYFYSYEMVDQVKGVKLVQPSAGTSTAFMDLWDRLYTALQSSTDVYIIAADIRRAFGDKVITSLVAPKADETILFSRLDKYQVSLMNAATVGLRASGVTAEENANASRVIAEAFKVYDGGNGILMNNPEVTTMITYPVGTSTSEALAHVNIPGFLQHLNFIEDEPSADAVVNAVRLKPGLTSKVTLLESPNNTITTLVAQIKFISVATEVILEARMYDIAEDPSMPALVASPATVSVFGSTRALMLANDSAACSNFDWLFPRVYVTGSWNPPNFRSVNLVEDTQNYVPITLDVLKQLHDATMLSEFGLPG